MGEAGEIGMGTRDGVGEDRSVARQVKGMQYSNFEGG